MVLTRASLQGNCQEQNKWGEEESCKKCTGAKLEFYRRFEASRFARRAVFGKFPVKKKASELIEVLKGIEKRKMSGNRDDHNQEWDHLTLAAIGKKFHLMENGVIGGKKRSKIIANLFYEDLYDRLCEWDNECTGIMQYYEKTTMYANLTRDVIQWYVNEFKNGESERMHEDASDISVRERLNAQDRCTPGFIKFLDTYTATMKLNKSKISDENKDISLHERNR